MNSKCINVIFSEVKKLIKSCKMIINRQGKFAILGDFERTDCSSSIRKANRCNSMVHMMLPILEDTIVIFSVKIQLSKIFKMITTHHGKFAAFEDFIRA